MGRFIVRQPDGLYAVFSTVVDDFILLDAKSSAYAIIAEPDAGHGKFMLHGVQRDADDPNGELWGYCMSARSMRWREPSWPEMTRLVCEIIERPRKPLPT